MQGLFQSTYTSSDYGDNIFKVSKKIGIKLYEEMCSRGTHVYRQTMTNLTMFVYWGWKMTKFTMKKTWKKKKNK